MYCLALPGRLQGRSFKHFFPAIQHASACIRFLMVSTWNDLTSLKFMKPSVRAIFCVGLMHVNSSRGVFAMIVFYTAVFKRIERREFRSASYAHNDFEPLQSFRLPCQLKPLTSMLQFLTFVLYRTISPWQIGCSEVMTYLQFFSGACQWWPRGTFDWTQTKQFLRWGNPSFNIFHEISLFALLSVQRNRYLVKYHLIISIYF